MQTTINFNNITLKCPCSFVIDDDGNVSHCDSSNAKLVGNKGDTNHSSNDEMLNETGHVGHLDDPSHLGMEVMYFCKSALCVN